MAQIIFFFFDIFSENDPHLNAVESFPSMAIGNVVQYTKPLLFQIFRISFTRRATPPKVIDYSFNPLIERTTTFLFSQFHKFFLNILPDIPYVKLMQDVLQDFCHTRICLCLSVIILPIQIPYSCKRSTALSKPSNSILLSCQPPVRERGGSLEYDQIGCPSTCKSRILHCSWGVTPTITKQMDFRLFFCTFKQQCPISCINPMHSRIKELLLDAIEC